MSAEDDDLSLYIYLSLCVCVLAEELILSFPWLDLLSFIFWWLVLGKFWLL